MHHVLGVRTDTAQDAKHRLNEKGRLHQPAVEKMRQVVEVTNVVALEFKAGAVASTGPQCVFDILKGYSQASAVRFPCFQALLGCWGAAEQNAELRILLQIRSAIKSGVLHFLVLAAQ